MSGFLELCAEYLDELPEHQQAPLARLAALDAEEKETRAREFAALEQRVAALERRLRPVSRVERALASDGRKA